MTQRYTEDFILRLERELVQARLKEAESQCALKEMQDKILDMEKVRPAPLAAEARGKIATVAPGADRGTSVIHCARFRGTRRCRTRATWPFSRRSLLG